MHEGRWQPALGRVLTMCTVAASGLWVPAMLVIAHAIRPAQLTDVTTVYPRAVREAVAADARQRMWTIVIASFLVLLALAAVTIILNRKAARVMPDEHVARPNRLGRWATGGMLLAVALADVVAVVKVDLSLSEFATLSLAVLAMAGAMAGLILCATALRRARTVSPGDSSRRRGSRQLGTRVGLVLASLLLLAGFVLTAVLAQFYAAFFLFLVY